MNPLKDLISGGVSGIVGSISDVIGRFVADPQKKLEAQTELTKIAAEHEDKLVAAAQDFVSQQASVVLAEAKGESWLQRTWRPITMLNLVAILDYHTVFAPIFHFTDIPLPPEYWTILTYGICGYVGLRSGEKITDMIVGAVKK